MADYESRDLATAARRAQEMMAGDDDRPSSAELAGDRIEASQPRLRVECPKCGGWDAKRIECPHGCGVRLTAMWTPTDHGYDEEAGW